LFGSASSTRESAAGGKINAFAEIVESGSGVGSGVGVFVGEGVRVGFGVVVGFGVDSTERVRVGSGVADITEAVVVRVAAVTVGTGVNVGVAVSAGGRSARINSGSFAPCSELRLVPSEEVAIKTKV
jgi:hypothetical protein